MKTAISEAIERHSQNEGVHVVTDPKPMQRVVCLVDTGYWYAPTLCQVKSVSAKTVTVYVYAWGKETKRVSRSNVFTEDYCAWCNTPSDLPYVGIYETVDSAGNDAHKAAIDHDRDSYTKLYSEKPTAAQVLADYTAQPETFKTVTE